MKPVRLYIENFICYERAFIDFTQFSVAQIIGKKENNDMVSNGVGKTTIFKAIEYVLFNQSDSPLERLVRDDTTSCQVVFDFLIGDQEYRLTRSRTKKGSTDLTLLQRNSQSGSTEEVYHSIVNNIEVPLLNKSVTNLYWKDLSGSRAGDTEKDLAKLIKINAKSFRSTVHFMQNDFTGLPTATPEKRKGILKEALNLAIYSKLEKIAKDKTNSLSKEIDRNKTLLENLGDPSQDLTSLLSQISLIDQTLIEKNDTLSSLNSELLLQNDKINELTNEHKNLESKFANLLSQEKTVLSEKNRLEISVKEYQSKKANTTKAAKDLVEEIKALKIEQVKLVEEDYSQIDILNEKISSLKEEITQNNLNIKSSMEEYEDLKIPLPSGSVCKNCRKPMSNKDRENHQSHISKEMVEHQETIKKCKEAIVILNKKIFQYQLNVNSLNLAKQQLEGINTKISAKNKEIQDKKALHEEYVALLTKFTNELEAKKIELEIITKKLANSSIDEAKELQSKIEKEKQNTASIMTKVNSINKEITHYNSNKAVLQHTIDQKNKDKDKFAELKKSLLEYESKFSMYPSVLQAFSSTGIPNLIIQNVLDDLQVEANNLLSQLKPGIQLSFFVEKTVEKTGDQADTLDINYQINGKDRYYEQLSGAQKLAVTFSLKLGLSFLLQKMIGTDIKLLLLDEIDQALDKASVDSFADIVKFFQKDFTILIITHNDRLKDKFSHAILVEQDINMVSKARVVSSW
jgi:DNA repair exonuclease SbcCD ATPase subunit